MRYDNDSSALMNKMWDNAKRYDRLIEWGDKHLKQFGWKIYFLKRFKRVRNRMDLYKNLRYSYVAMALALSRKVIVERRAKRIGH